MYTACMSAFSKPDRHFLESVAGLGYSNPFLPERIAFEKAALGRDFVPSGSVWSASVTDPDATPPNVNAIYKKLNERIEDLHARLVDAPEVHEEEFAIFEES